MMIGRILLGCLLCACLSAAPITLTATLSGLNENPPVVTPGSGTATVILDSEAHTLSVSAAFSGLIGATTAAHIHCCTAPPANVGVATMTPSFVGFPLGVTSGVFSNTFDTTLASTFNAAYITASGGTVAGAEAALFAGLLAGQAYFNIHTSFSPGGEIRGFLSVQASAVPEPATLALVGLSLAGLALSRRRQKA